MNTPRHPGRLTSLAILMMAATFTLVSCEDFFGAEDLKQIIKEDVETATAEEVLITLAAESDSMGVPSPFGAQRFKVGSEHTISTTVGSDYAFKEWTHDGSPGDVTFSNPYSVSTKMTINRIVTGLSVIPTFDARPYILTTDPWNNQVGVIRTTPIRITFSEPVDLNTTTLSNISLSQRVRGSSSDPIPINAKFGIPTLSGSTLTLPLLSGESMGDSTAEYEVFLQINKNIADLAGNLMSSNALPVRFFTSVSEDENQPVIVDDIKVKTSGGTLITVPGNPTSSSNIKIDFEAADAESPVIYALITSNIDGTLYDDAYQRDIDVSLNGAEGSRTLTVVVRDPSDNISIAKTVNVLYDHTIPTVTTPVLGASFYGSPLVISGSATDPGGAPSGIQRVQYSFDGTTWTNLIGATSWSGSLVLASPEGAKTLHVRSQDNAGNYSSTGLAGFTYDASDPTLSETGIGTSTEATRAAAFTISGNANDSNLLASLEITATKNGVNQGSLLIQPTPGAYTYTQPVNTVTHSDDGLWVYTITATDAVGRTSTLTRTVRVDTIAPVISLSTPPVSGARKIGDSIVFVFDGGEPGLVANSSLVNGKTAVLTSSGSTYTFTYTVTSGDAERAVGAVPVNLSLRDAAGNISNAHTTPPPDVSVDAHAPVINLTAPPVAGARKIGDTIVFIFNGGESGLIANSLLVNGKTAVLTSSGSTYTLTYTIASGDANQTAGFVPVNFSLRDAAGNISNAHTTPPPGVSVDANAPVISLTTPPVAGARKIGDTIEFIFNGGEAGLLANSLLVNGKTAVLTSSGSTYTLTYTVASGDEDRAADNVPVNFSLRDAAGNISNAHTTPPPGVSVDAHAPTINLITAPAAGTRKIGDTIEFVFNGGESGLLANSLLVNGKTAVLTSSGSTYTLTYTVASGDVDRAADNVPVNFSLRDAAGNVSEAYTMSPTGVSVDANVPEVLSVTSTTVDDRYTEGEVISIQVTFSETVTVTNSPKLTLELSPTDRDAVYDSGTGTDTLTFIYTVEVGDTSSDLDYVHTNALYPDDGTIQDAAGNNANLTLASPGTPGSLGANSNIVIDTTPPANANSVTAVGGTTAGTVLINWLNPADTDIAETLISWSTGSARVATTVPDAAGSYTTPVLAVALYTFTIKVVDFAGNQSSGITIDATPVASTLTLTGVEVAKDTGSTEGPTLSWATNSLPIGTLYYWAGASFKPDTGYFSASTPANTGTELSGLSDDKTFSFLFVSDTDIESITYTFTWDGSNYDDPPLSRSLSLMSSASAQTLQSITTYTNPPIRRPASTFNPITYTTPAIPPATTAAQWLAPMAAKAVAGPTSSTEGSAASTGFNSHLSESTQAKARAILAAYEKPAATTNQGSTLARAPINSGSGTDSSGIDARRRAAPETASIASSQAPGTSTGFLSGYSSQPDSSQVPDQNRAPDRAPDRAPGPNPGPNRTPGRGNGVPPAEAVMPIGTQSKVHDEDSEETDLV